jgi:hypothetical protein
MPIFFKSWSPQSVHPLKKVVYTRFPHQIGAFHQTQKVWTEVPFSTINTVMSCHVIFQPYFQLVYAGRGVGSECALLVWGTCGNKSGTFKISQAVNSVRRVFVASKTTFFDLIFLYSPLGGQRVGIQMGPNCLGDEWEQLGIIQISCDFFFLSVRPFFNQISC